MCVLHWAVATASRTLAEGLVACFSLHLGRLKWIKPKFKHTDDGSRQWENRAWCGKMEQGSCYKVVYQIWKR